MLQQNVPFVTSVCLLAFTCSLLGQVFSSSANELQTRFYSGWLGGNKPPENKRLTSRFLPASLQVLEHTASQVNGSWGGSETEKKGTRPLYEEIQPLPGLMRLTILRNSLLVEAKASNLENFDGFSPVVEEQLQASAKSPLPEQLATVLQHTVDAGELQDLKQRVRGNEISQLTAAVIEELRDPATELARVLRRFESLNYAP